MRDVLARWRVVLLAGVCAVSVIGSAPLSAQAQGSSAPATVSGTILDQQGNSVADATVILSNTSTNVTRTVVSDGKGRFSAADLPPGVYAVEVVARGFATARRPSLQIAAGKTETITVSLSVAAMNEEITVSAPEAVKTAPSQVPLAARSAQSLISDEFVRESTAPAADFTQVLQAAPGLFTTNANGPGLGDAKMSFRGFKDGDFTISFDGIPFNDTNTPSHHSWVFFPSQFLGGAAVDRSPGSAASIGPANFGGSVNLQSRNLSASSHALADVSYGSFNTRLYNTEFESGGSAKTKFMVNAHEMRSDGYQTFNAQRRDAFSGKFQRQLSNKTTLTGFGSFLELNSNTPDANNPTRDQVTQFGPDYLMVNDPTQPNYYGYMHYHVTTDFEYFGVKSDLGHGWSIDNKIYEYAYHNHEHFNAMTGAITATSGTNKFNAYRTFGNILPVTFTSGMGVLRTGLWSQVALTNRYQVPEDPRTLKDAALPNFHETFTTTTLQPYVEYELKVTSRLRVTPGVKYAYYGEDFKQFADGKTVGNLGGAPAVLHSAAYKTWLPSFDAHYFVLNNLSVYGQYAKGDEIPPTKAFDVTNGQVGVLPKSTTTRTRQFGGVFQASRLMLGVDTYHTTFDNTYSGVKNTVTGDTDYFSGGTSVSQGVEAEGNVVIGGGFSTYLNGTKGSAKFTSTGLWLQNTPKDTETIGVTYKRSGWTVNMFEKRIGRQFNDNSSTHEAIVIDPFHVTNMFVSYALNRPSPFSKQIKVRLSVNNVLDKHYLVGVSPASKTSSLPAGGDLLTLTAGRSVAVSFTVDFARRP